MSIKKMALLVSSGLVFFLVASIVINTVSVTRKKAMNKISSIIKYEINPDVTVSSYNFVEVVPEQEEVKEEEVIVTEPVKAPVGIKPTPNKGIVTGGILLNAVSKYKDILSWNISGVIAPEAPMALISFINNLP